MPPFPIPSEVPLNVLPPLLRFFGSLRPAELAPIPLFACNYIMQIFDPTPDPLS